MIVQGVVGGNSTKRVTGSEKCKESWLAGDTYDVQSREAVQEAFMRVDSGLGRVASHVDIYPCNTVFIYFAGNFSTQAIRTMTVDEVLSGDNSVRTNDMSIQYSDIRVRLQFLLDHIYRALINR